MNLKKILKTLKLHEDQISFVLGVIILLIAGIFLLRYVRNLSSPVQPVNQQSQAQTEVQTQTHTVTKGESVWSIAEKYYGKGDNWKKIADANSLKDARKIEVGENLVIPSLTEEQTTTPQIKQPSQTPTPQITPEAASTVNEITGDSYIVIKGDNLWTIAVRAYGNGYKWVDIARANNLKNPNLIHSGNVFTIPH